MFLSPTVRGLTLALLGLVVLPGCSSTCCRCCPEPGMVVAGTPDAEIETPASDAPAEAVAEEAPADGAESPEALIAALKESFDRDDADMSGMIPYVLPEQRGMLAFMMGLLVPQMTITMGEAMVGMSEPEELEKNKAKFAKMKDDFNALLKKHGVNMEGEEAGQSAMMQMEGDPAAAIEATRKMFEGVDHAAFIKESVAFMKQFADAENTAKLGTPAQELKLEDVTIEVDGDKAVATAKGEEDPLHLIKRDGRWFIDFMAMMKK